MCVRMCISIYIHMIICVQLLWPLWLKLGRVSVDLIHLSIPHLSDYLLPHPYIKPLLTDPFILGQRWTVQLGIDVVLVADGSDA